MKRITAEEAKELNRNFENTRSKELNKIVKNEKAHIHEKDAISSWFSLDELKEYIAYVEAEGKAKDITVNGIRIYFGAYSEKDKNKDKNGLSTLFLVPTQSKIGAQQKEDIMSVEGSSDITDIDAMNRGVLGYPPSATYPQ